MQLICAQCDSPVPAQHINVKSDLAKCPACGAVHKASELLTQREYELARALYPPEGSKIDIYEVANGDVEITLPPKGFGGGTAFLAVFATFWLTFVAVWTFFASMGSIFFALFSIPFWMVGLGMGFSVINSIWETQRIRVQEDSLLIRKQRPLFPKEVRLALPGISYIGRKKLDPKDMLNSWDKVNSLSLSQSSQGSSGKEVPVAPVIKAGIKEYPLFEHISKEEAFWLIYTLKDLIRDRLQGPPRQAKQAPLPEEAEDLSAGLDDWEEDWGENMRE